PSLSPNLYYPHLYFSGSGAHAALHSCPTRRSSDLDHRLGALPALDQAVLHQVLVQSYLHLVRSFSCPASRACRTACTRLAASRPWSSFSSGTVAWVSLVLSTARWMKVPRQPSSVRRATSCWPMPPAQTHSSAKRIVLNRSIACRNSSVKGNIFTSLQTLHGMPWASRAAPAASTS